MDNAVEWLWLNCQRDLFHSIFLLSLCKQRCVCEIFANVCLTNLPEGVGGWWHHLLLLKPPSNGFGEKKNFFFLRGTGTLKRPRLDGAWTPCCSRTGSHSFHSSRMIQIGNHLL